MSDQQVRWEMFRMNAHDRTINLVDAMQAVKTAILGEKDQPVDHSIYQRCHDALLSVPGYKPSLTPSPTPPEAATEPLGAHMAVLREAFKLHEERERERQGVWRRSGIKGQVFACLAKAERAFGEAMRGQMPNRDHLLDLINYAAFALRLWDELQDDNDVSDAMNGDWPWG